MCFSLHFSIQLIRDRLLNESKGSLLKWLQKVLIECCFIKLNIDKLKEDRTPLPSMEPIAFHCIGKF